MTRLFRNTLFMLMLNIFGRASGFVRYLLLAHFLVDDETFGLVYLALNFSGIGRHFMDGGLDNLVTRDGARRKDLLPTYTATALAIKATLAVVFIVLTFAYVGWRGFDSQESLTFVVAVVFVSALSLTGVLRSGFSALERMEYVFYTYSPCRLAALVLVTAALLSSYPLWVIVACVHSENLIWFALCFYFIHRFYRVADGTCSWGTAIAMLKESWPLAVYGFFNILYLRLDALMLEWLVGMKDTGIYGKSQYLVEGVTLIVSGYIVAVYPVFSRLYKRDEERFRALYTQSMAVIVAVVLPASVMLGGFADVWAELIPRAKGGMEQLLPLLAWTMVSAISNSFLISIFTARDCQRWLVGFLLLAVVISFGSNYLLIPVYRTLGAAAASLLSQGVLLATMLVVLRGRMGLSPPLARWGLALVGCMAALFVARLLPDSLRYLRPILFGVLAPVSLLALRVVGMDDIRKFRNLSAEVGD